MKIFNEGGISPKWKQKLLDDENTLLDHFCLNDFDEIYKGFSYKDFLKEVHAKNTYGFDERIEQMAAISLWQDLTGDYEKYYQRNKRIYAELCDEYHEKYGRRRKSPRPYVKDPTDASEIFDSMIGLKEKFGTDAWRASDKSEDGIVMPNAEDREFNKGLRNRMLEYAWKIITPFWNLLKDIDQKAILEENGYDKDKSSSNNYDAYQDTVGEFWVHTSKYGGGNWLDRAKDIIEAHKDELGITELEVRNYRNSESVFDITVYFKDDEPGLYFYHYDDGFHGIAIEVLDTTRRYEDAYYGLDDTGKRNKKAGLGGYSKESKEYDLITSKFIIDFKFDEDPSLNYKSKPLSASKAVAAYYDLLNENPAYKDAIAAGALRISIKQQYSWNEVPVEKLEELIKKYGKTATSWKKRHPVEPARFRYKEGYRRNPYNNPDMNNDTIVFNNPRFDGAERELGTESIFDEELIPFDEGFEMDPEDFWLGDDDDYEPNMGSMFGSGIRP